MKLVESFLTNNPCYTQGRKITVKGLMLHSVGCPQPSASVFIRNWNKSSYDKACVHGFIDGNDGTVYQTLPWNHRGWHAGGSANNTHIGVEMCETACIKYTGGATFTCSDKPTAQAVATRTYESAVELFAMLCTEFGLDPLADGVIISHAEGAKRGVASNHADPEHLWRQLGLPYTMDTFRKAVSAKIGVQTVDSSQKSSENGMWDYLLTQIGNEYGVAGLMGNLYAESGLKSNNLQNSYNKKLNITDEEYTLLVDGNNYPNFVTDKAGYGLAQWTFHSRKKNLLDFAKQKGCSIGDEAMQLEFLIHELKTGYKSVFDILVSARSVEEAAVIVLTGYEKPANQSDAVKKKRTAYGQTIYDQYAKGIKPTAVTDTSFRVKTTVADLNIRKDPGTNYERTGKQTGIGVFTIVQTSPGQGSKSGWGKLKSGAGWISLDYTKRV